MNIITEEPIQTRAGWAYVVGSRPTGYVIVQDKPWALEVARKVVSEAPFNPRRLRRVAVPATTALHEYSVKRWERIHGECLPPAAWRAA